MLFDVEELPTHGGSLRTYFRHKSDGTKPIAPAVDAMLAAEVRAGFDRLPRYLSFGPEVQRAKRRLLSFLIEPRRRASGSSGTALQARGTPC